MASTTSPAAPAPGATPATAPALEAPAAPAPTASPSSAYAIRLPAALQTPSTPSQPALSLPSREWLLRTWHVTHSTLPMWKDKRNVQIRYAALDGGRIDDEVSYQALSGDKVSTIEGVDTPNSNSPGSEHAEIPTAFQWRGKRWLKPITSRWEVVGAGAGEAQGEDWAVTYFAKTLFTPAGIDVYSSSGAGVSEGTLGRIREAIRAVDSKEMGRLEGELFGVTIDGARSQGAK